MMFKKGLAVAVILLFIGVAFAIPINANVSKSSVDISVEEDVTPTPIALVLQLITKLRNHKDIQNVETEDDVLQIIESDEELNSIVEQLSVEDCGCDEDSSPIGWNFPILCTLLIPLAVIGLLIFLQTHQTGFIDFINLIVDTIGCSWA